MAPNSLVTHCQTSFGFAEFRQSVRQRMRLRLPCTLELNVDVHFRQFQIG